MLRESIRDVMPRRLGTNKNMLARTSAQITIDSSYRYLANYSGMYTGQR
jgi:hypothetical protein